MEELFYAWNCVRYAVEPESRVFFALIYLYFGYEHGDTRNFNDNIELQKLELYLLESYLF